MATKKQAKGKKDQGIDALMWESANTMASTINAMEGDIESLFQKNPLKFRHGPSQNKEIKYISWDVPTKMHPNGIDLMHITDVQFGHVNCNVKRMIEFRDWILEEPNRYMLWGGDMIDAGTKVSVGSPWEQMCEPQGQIYRFCELWAPARHRVLGYVGGNHERRGSLTYGDLGKTLATILRVPYSSGIQLIDVHYGKHTPFKIKLHHGRGASVTAGARMNMVERTMKDLGDSQLYLVGHLHQPMLLFQSRPVRNPDNTIGLQKTCAAMSGSFLEYFGGYAEVMNLSSAPLLMTNTTLEPSGHWQVTLR